MAKERRFDRDEIEFGRAVTFFDAVYAFSLTLLITTVDDFSPKAWSSPPALWQANGSSLASFAISFLVVVQFWRANHAEMATFRHLDNRLIALNTAVLFGVVLIPFTTEAMGEPGLQDLPLPVALYAVNVSATYLLQRAVTVLADRRDLRDRPRTSGERRESAAAAVVVPLVFLGSILPAYLVNPTAAQISWLSLFVLVPLAMRWAAARSHPSATDAAR